MCLETLDFDYTKEERHSILFARSLCVVHLQGCNCLGSERSYLYFIAVG